MNNYTVFHCHSDLSNGTTNIDSVTKFTEYVDYAAELGMKALAFSEHGSIFEWYHKKEYIESKGMKYIHACEVYITETLDEKIKDNYHCVLIAKNYDGFKELNRLISQSFNRTDNHFYYVPRILFSDLLNTSDNIIVTTACIGGVLAKSNNLRQRFLEFLTANKNRCFLETQHHNDNRQIEYNRQLAIYNRKYGIPLIAGTDTHALNAAHVKGRKILQLSKDIYFPDENNWDLTFKSYDELIRAYSEQCSLPEKDYMEAIHNTNVMAEMIEPFELDKNTKYPKLYDDPEKAYKVAINKAYKNHKYAVKRYTKEEVKNTVNAEFEVYKATKSIDFMMLEVFMREWEKKNDIQCGYARGSVSGSFIAYLLGITQMDSKKFGLNFFRFMNPSRVTNADIDTDYSGTDRIKVKEFLLKDRMNLPNIRTSEIITFNTIAMKGAIKDVCRALKIDLTKSQELSDAVYVDENKQSKVPDHIREQYPEVFEYVDIVNGTIVSIGSHPSGVLVSDRNIDEDIGMCTLSTSPYPVSMLNMKELDSLMYVKLDILGLDNVGLINDTCKMIGIELLTPDNTNLYDESVWKSIRDDTTLIFQWESDSAQDYLKRFMSDETLEIAKSHNKDFSYIKWFSFGNGLIRPGCASFRDDVANGTIITTGFTELDDFLAVTFGRITMQEDIMKFLVKFCGYSDVESDNVRRGIAKKYGTEKFIDEIHDRFIEYSNKTYGVDKDKLEYIFPPIKQGILDASSYAFSWNHSDSYSCIGYICGYLRYYYPLEFLTVALNTFVDNDEKSVKIKNYCDKVGINILPVRFRHSSDVYSADKESNQIYKGIASIKYLNTEVAQKMYEMRDTEFSTFIDFLAVNPCDTRQTEILIKLGFFREFGKSKKLLEIFKLYIAYGTKKQISKDKISLPEETVLKYATATSKLYKVFNMNGLLSEMCSTIEDKSISLSEIIAAEIEYLGYIQTTIPSLNDNYYAIVDINDKYANRVVKLYRLNNGDMITVKIKGKVFVDNPVKKNDIIKTLDISEEPKWGKTPEGEWYRKEETELILKKWANVR